MKRLLITVAALALGSTAALATNSYNPYAAVGDGYANSSTIIQDNSIDYGRYGVGYNPYAHGNEAYTAQLGKFNKNTTVQSGDKNYQYLYQNGYFNTNATWQFGIGNKHIGVQDGFNNGVLVAQLGVYNSGKTFQFGSNNKASIVQAGATKFMKPDLDLRIAVKAEHTAASLKKLITKPGVEVGPVRSYWAPKH